MTSKKNHNVTLQELVRGGQMFTVVPVTREGKTRTVQKHNYLTREMFIANAFCESEDIGRYNYKVFQHKLDRVAIKINAVRRAIELDDKKAEKTSMTEAIVALQEVYDIYNTMMGTWEKKGKVRTAKVKATRDAVVYIMERTVKNVKGIDSKNRVGSKTGINSSAQAFGVALQKQIECTYYNLFHCVPLPKTRLKKVDEDKAMRREKAVAKHTTEIRVELVDEPVYNEAE